MQDKTRHGEYSDTTLDLIETHSTDVPGQVDPIESHVSGEDISVSSDLGFYTVFEATSPPAGQYRVENSGQGPFSEASLAQPPQHDDTHQFAGPVLTIFRADGQPLDPSEDTGKGLCFFNTQVYEQLVSRLANNL